MEKKTMIMWGVLVLVLIGSFMIAVNAFDVRNIFYRVYAVNEYGNSSYSNIAGITLNQEGIIYEENIKDITRIINLQIPANTEIKYFDKKYANNSGLIIYTPIEATCYWKPDRIDNGIKNCEAVFNIEGAGELNLSKIITTFANDRLISNIKYEYSNSYIFKNETYLNSTRIEYYKNETAKDSGEVIEKRIENVTNEHLILQTKEFKNFNDKLPDTTKPFAVKVLYETPKYSFNSFNLSIGSDVKIDPEQSECGTLSTANGVYTLNQSVSSTGNCFTISANNITLDCGGYVINYSFSPPGSGAKYGVNVVGINNSVIKNCNIFEGVNGSGTGKHGIYYSGGFNGTILNNSLFINGTQSDGIEVIGATNLQIINNSIVNIGDTSYNMPLLGSNYTFVSGNNLNTSQRSRANIRVIGSYSNNISSNVLRTGGGTSPIGVFISTSSANNAIRYNIISTWGATGTGVQLSDGIAYNDVTGNNISVYGGGNGFGINLNNNRNNNITDNWVYANTTNSNSIYLANSSNNLVYRNTLINTGGARTALRIDSPSSSYNIIDSNTISIYANSFYGVSLVNGYYNNITNNIINYTGSASYGMFLGVDANYTLIRNNNVTGSGGGRYGIHVSTSANVSILDNQVYLPVSSDTTYGGISGQTAVHSLNIINNTIIGGSTAPQGIYAIGGNYVNISNNYIFTNSSSYGLRVANGEYITIMGNSVIEFGTGDSGNYIGYLTNVSLSTISNNSINGTKTRGFSINTGSSRNVFNDNNIYINSSSTFANGFALEGSVIKISSNVFNNNIIRTGSGASSVGILFVGTTDDNHFYNTNITTYGASQQGVYIYSGSNNFTFEDSSISAQGNDFATATTVSAAGVVNFTNVSFVEAVFGNPNTTLNVHWWADVYTNYTNGTIAGNSNVSAWDVNGNLMHNNLTGSDGLTRFRVLDYSEVNTTGITNYNDYTFNATSPNEAETLTQSINVSTNRFLNFQFAGGQAPPADNEYPQFSNYWDDNSTLVGSGVANFNVTLLSTNGTVFLQINNSNFTAFNITGNIFNISITLINDTYPYQWISWGNGTSNLFNISETRYYTINETTPPPADNEYPLFSNYYDNNGTINTLSRFNTTLQSTNGTVFLQINNTNYTAYNITDNIFNVTFNFTNSGASGVYPYQWISWGNGTSNNFNISATRYYTITMDNIFPLINITFPLNKTYTINVSTLNYTFTEANPQSCWYSLNFGVTNVSVTCGNNLTGLTSYEGNNTWTIWINDTANNVNSSSVTFYKDTLPPVCSLMSRTPNDLADNSTGVFSAVINCTDSSGINITKIGDHYPFFITRSVDAFILLAGVPNYWSNRYPNNSLSVVGTLTPPYKIWRALGRNRGFWFENITDTTLRDCTGASPCYAPLNDSFSYAIEDGNYGHFTVTNTSTEYIINYTHPAVDIAAFRQSVYLSYEAMVKEAKKNYTVSKNNYLLMKRFDAEAYRNTSNYTTNNYRNILATGSPIKTLRIFYCNSSYNPAGTTQVIDSPNCELMNSLPASEFSNIIFTDRNSSYSKGIYGITNGKIGNIQTTAEYYLEYESPESATGKGYNIKYANGSTLEGLDVDFHNSSVAWTTTNGGTTWTQAAFTPDVFTTTTRNTNDQFQFGIYACDNKGNCYKNFTFIQDDITQTNHPISYPLILEYNSSNYQMDINLNETHKGIMNIKIGVAKDPDSVGNVTHNLSLMNLDGSFNYTINTSFKSPNDADTLVDFNTSLVPDGIYRMNIWAIAGDNLLDTKNRTTDRNFTINNSAGADMVYPIFSNFQEVPSNGSTYSLNGIYQFNTTITSTNETAGIEFNGVNYSLSNVGDIFNKSIINLGVGVYPYYYWAYGNGTAYNYNTTAMKYYTINKATPTLSYLYNGQTTNLTLTYPQQINISATTNIGTIGLDRDNVNVLTENSLNITLAAGTYIYRANVSGNQNYSDIAYRYYNATINKASQVATLVLNESSPITYGTNINVTCNGELYRNDLNVTAEKSLGILLGAGSYYYSCQLFGNQNYSYDDDNSTLNVNQASQSFTPLLNGNNDNLVITYPQQINASYSGTNQTGVGITINGTAVTIGANYTWGAGSYVANYSAPQNQNYSGINYYLNLTINQATSLVYLYLNNTRSDINISSGEIIDINATLQTGEGIIQILKDNSIINSGSSPLYNATNFTSSGLYNITAYYPATQNYSTSSETWFVNVSGAGDMTAPYFTIIPADQTINYTDNFGVRFEGTDAIAFGYYSINWTDSFAINQSGWLKNTTQLTVGIYKINVIINDTAGNQNSTIYTLTIDRKIASCTINSNSPQVYPNPINVSGSCINTEVAVKLYRNGTEVIGELGIDKILGAGNYLYELNVSQTQNYTSATTSTTITISQNTSSQVSLYLNNSQSNISILNGTAIWINGTLDVGSGTIQLYMDEGIINSGNSPLENYTWFNGSEGLKNITLIYLGNENYSRVSKTYWVNVTLLTTDAPPYFTIIPAGISQSYPSNFGVLFEGADAVGFGYYSINWTTLFSINQSGWLSNTGALGVGNYLINVTINDTSNNINSTIYSLNITQNNTYVLSISGTTPITYGTTTNVAGSGCPAELSCSLDKSNEIYGVGTETFNYSTSGNTNYSANSITKDITITKASGLVYTYINGTRANKSGNNATYNLTGRLITGNGNINLYVNDNIWNTGASPLTNISLFTVGTYKINTTYAGNQNYSYDDEVWTLTISEAAPPSASKCAGNYTYLNIPIKSNAPYVKLCHFINRY